MKRYAEAVTNYAFALSFAVAGLLAVGAPALADIYPSRPVTIIVPYPPGGPTDHVARQAAQVLSDKLKQKFIVENVSGGGTIIATHRVARAAPDGYTLLLHNLQISANATLYKTLPFDTDKDLTPVMFINRNPMVLVGRKTLAANTLPELTALMKKEKLNAAIPGFGATGHLATSLFAQETNVPVAQIPHRGGTPAVTAIIGGHIDLFFGTPQQLLPHITAGEMKAFGITTKDRLPQFPNTDSFVKVLGPKFEIHYWQALFAPTGTPDTIINTLNSTLEGLVSDPAVLKIWENMGVSAYPKDERSPTAGRKIFKSEIARWGQVIRDNKIQAEQ